MSRLLLRACMGVCGVIICAAPALGVVGGTDAPVGAYGTAVALVDPTKDDFDGQFCAGTLVAADRVLTAAHCVTEENKRGGLSVTAPARIGALVGATSLVAGQGRRVSVSAVSVHPLYLDTNGAGPDLAVLTLTTPVTEVAPSPVAGPAQAIAWAAGRPVVVVGWGAMTDNTYARPEAIYPQTLKRTVLGMLAPATCALVVGDIQGGQTLCAGGPLNRTDACYGDSGGPLFGTDALGLRVLVGVVSRGDGCARPGRPGIYQALAPLSGWLATQGVATLAGTPEFIAPPRAQPLRAEGVSGRGMKLRWRVSPRAEPTAADVIIKHGGVRRGALVDWRRAPLARADRAGMRTIGWRSPPFTRRVTLAWCVVPRTGAGVAGPARCARITLDPVPGATATSASR